MRNGINHITKLEFLLAFRAAFNASITLSNILGGFRGAGILPFNPDTIISKLNVRLVTPPGLPDSAAPWSAKTPGNQAGFISQTTLIKDKIT